MINSLSARLPSWEHSFAVFKVISPPIFSVLLLTILILIPTVARGLGNSAFLVSTYLHLFFYPEGPLGEHIERIVIHLVTCAISLAFTSLFICITVWIDGNNGQGPYTTNGSKALGACILTLWAFIGGFCQSRFPRIKFAMRIFLFSSVWTISTGASRISSDIFTDQFYPAAIAAGTSLLTGFIIFPHGAGSDFAKSLIKIHDMQRAVLNQSVADFFRVHNARKPSLQLLALRKELSDMTTKLKHTYESASLEVTYGRLAVIEARPLVASLKRSKGWIHCGMGLGTREAVSDTSSPDDSIDGISKEGSVHEDKLLEQLKPCIYKLLETLDSSITIVGACVALTLDGGSTNKTKTCDRYSCLYDIESAEESKRPSLVLAQQRRKMSEAIEAFKDDLAFVLKRLAASTISQKSTDRDDKQSASSDPASIRPHSGQGLFSTNIYDAAFLMVSLLELAKEVGGDLVTCQNMLVHWHNHSRKRLWLPGVTFFSWMKMKFSKESQTGFVFHNDEMDAIRKELLVFSETEEMAKDRREKENLGSSVTHWAHRSDVIRWRIKASNTVAFLKHSIHIRYALKLAGGVVLLSLPAWMKHTRPWFQNERGQWLLVTYVWVLETSTGATIRISIYRAVATISSVIYAIIVWYISSQGNRYAIGLFIILAELPASFFILYTKHAQSLGLVFAFTQSVILFYPFTSAGVNEPVTVTHLGLIRGYQILLGISAAFLVNIFVWPLHARVFLLRTISRITTQCSTEYLSLARQMLNSGVIIGPETSRKFAKLEDNIQIELLASQEYLEIMHIELSLIPKPVHTLSLVLKTLQRVADLLVLLRKCREVALRIIQKESCFNVLNLRRELVSNLLLSFWIVGQSLVTKEPMPQFLPSCRVALAELTEAMRMEISANPLEVRTERNDVEADHLVTLPPIANFPNISKRRNRPGQRQDQGQSGQSTPRQQQKVIDYSYFFVFAEHTMLSEIIFEVEKLLFLTKMLVGESSFIDSQYLPRHDYFDPSMVDSHDVNAFHHSMTEHGIDGRRLLSQLDAQLRAAKAEAAIARAGH